jgi:hypothetical protein
MTPSLSPLTRRSRRAVAASILGAVAFLSACSSSEKASTTAVAIVSDTATTGDTVAAAAQTSAAGAPSGVDPAARKVFSDCLKANGVELPEGGLGAPGAGGALPEGVDATKMQTAFSACKDKLPAGAALPGIGAGGAGGPDLSAFTTCLKDNGVTVAEPFDFSKLDLKDPAFTAAAKTCAPLLPDDMPIADASAPTTIAAG